MVSFCIYFHLWLGLFHYFMSHQLLSWWVWPPLLSDINIVILFLLDFLIKHTIYLAGGCGLHWHIFSLVVTKQLLDFYLKRICLCVWSCVFTLFCVILHFQLYFYIKHTWCFAGRRGLNYYVLSLCYMFLFNAHHVHFWWAWSPLDRIFPCGLAESTFLDI